MSLFSFRVVSLRAVLTPSASAIHFDRSPETNELLWFAAPPMNVARPGMVRHSLKYLAYLAGKRKGAQGASGMVDGEGEGDEDGDGNGDADAEGEADDGDVDMDGGEKVEEKVKEEARVTDGEGDAKKKQSARVRVPPTVSEMMQAALEAVRAGELGG